MADQPPLDLIEDAASPSRRPATQGARPQAAAPALSGHITAAAATPLVNPTPDHRRCATGVTEHPAAPPRRTRLSAECTTARSTAMARTAPPLPSPAAADLQASRAAARPAARVCLFCVRPVLDDSDRCPAFAQAGQAAHQSCCGCAAWSEPPLARSRPSHIVLRALWRWLASRGRPAQAPRHHVTDRAAGSPSTRPATEGKEPP